MIKKVLEEYGIEVSGGITTVTPDLNDTDKKRQRLFETFCYCNEPMRNLLIQISEYTASLFDEFIIDDFFFTQCMCDDCCKEKGTRTWEQFRLEKMKEVSENLILKPAKKVNPKCKVIIKYPNWRESYQETGYNPEEQRFMFDSIYTGTETRHSAQQDQHLPRYLSYSLPIYMENVLPKKNGGGWFDPFDCDRIDTYLEQAYLTAFSKTPEIMMFCWPALYNNKRATPLKFMYQKLDRVMAECGNPVGLPVYIPFNSQGEDHIEDFLGMVGIAMEPTPDFPDVTIVGKKNLLVTQSSLKDKDVIEKIKKYTAAGGKVIATGGFITSALKQEDFRDQLFELTSVRYNEKSLFADEFQFTTPGHFGRTYVNSKENISFSLLEHRNNATWSIINAGHGEYHESILMYDTYQKGVFEILNLPQMPSRIKDLPKEVLTQIRYELSTNGIWIDGEYGVSLFTYDNQTFGLYSYTNDGCAPQEFNVHIKGKIKQLKLIQDSEEIPFWQPKEILPECTKYLDRNKTEEETSFHVRINPGDFIFFKIEK